MKLRKPIILIMVLVCFLAFSGCKNGEDSSRVLWDSFVKSVNNDSHEGIAKCFYDSATSQYNYFLEKEENFARYDKIDSIKTLSYELTSSTDISSRLVPQLYESALVKCEVQIGGETKQLEFNVYSCRVNTSPWLFSTQLTIDFETEEEKLGNLPDDLWLKNALLVYNGFQYRKAYKITSDGITYSSVSIIKYIGNEKEVVVPDEIEGLPVVSIKKFAFAKFSKIFQVTFPGSKLTKVTIGKNVKSIDDYAFFQCRGLTEVVIPESVNTIGDYAFASSKRIKTIKIMVDDSELYTEDLIAPIESTSTSDLSIVGARNMYVGDIIRLSEGKDRLVKWSVNSSNVASIDEDKGIITANSNGNVTITCSLKSDPTIKATVTINVSSAPQKIRVQSSAFERCRRLEELYFYSSNPNTISVAGTALRLPGNVKIYVPKGSVEMYANSSLWSSFKENFYPIEE